MTIKGILGKFGIQDFVILISIIPILQLQLTDFASDPGVGWHLTTGKYISDTGRVPRIDPFLYSLSPRLWICDQWLSDLIVYKLFSIASWPLVYSVMLVSYLAAYFLILLPTISNTTKSWIASILIAFLAMRAGLIHFVLRPVIFGQLMFCLTFALITFFRAGRVTKRTFFILSGLIFLLWANLHPSFGLGLILLGCLVLESLYQKVWVGSSDKDLKITAVQACLLLVFCFLVTLVNPNGVGLHKSILWLATNDFFLSYHSEWHSPGFKAPEGKILQLFLLVLCLAPFFRNQKVNNPHAVDVYDMLSLIVFGHLSLEMVRTLPHFLIVASLPVAKSLTGMLKAIFNAESSKIKQGLQFVRRLERRESNSCFGLVTFILVSGYILFQSVNYGRLPYFAGEFGPPSKLRATDIIEFLKFSYKNSKAVVLASPDFGGAITFYGDQIVKAVIDDRNTLLGEEPYKVFNKQIYSMPFDDNQIKVYARSVGATHLLLNEHDALTAHLEGKGMTPIINRDGFVVFKLEN